MGSILRQIQIHGCKQSSLLLGFNKYLFNVVNRKLASKDTMRVLNVAEKNDAAKNIADIISRGSSRRRDGLCVYNKIYEFNTQLWNQNCQMIMTSVSGHLLGYEFQGVYRKWQGCNPLSLFDAPVSKQCSDETYIKIKRTLEREVRNCQALIIWTDCDREGENIGFEIIEVCQAVKPNIPIYRAKFSEITQVSINRALQTLDVPNKAVSNAVDVRSELDLRIGAAFTRFQTLRLQKVFPRTLGDLLISYGSCQFPTLGFVVERYLAIDRFKPEPYWKIKVIDDHDNVSVEFRWSRVRLFEELPCQVFLDICLENPNATVQKVTKKPKSKWRPVPLDTIELEKQGSRKLHLNAKETMKIAEKLYTQGLISYPRTETNIFPKDFNLTSLVNQHTGNSLWGTFATRLLEIGITPRMGKKSDQAHPPIHPTKYTDTLQGNEAKVYEFIVRHFLACLSKNAEGYETIVEIDISGEKFIANGLQILEKNYLEVYIYEKWSDKEIHEYQEGQIFRPTDISMIQEETSPPNLLTEADLIALMDKHGIGTDATHAEHIDTIKARQYVGLTNNQHFLPGKLGIGLVMGYDEMGFQMSKPHLRSELERDLKLICEGKKDPKVVLQNQIDKYREVFKVALERAHLIDTSLAQYIDEQPTQVEQPEIILISEEKSIFKCPKCGLNMTLKDKKQGQGKYIGCMGFPTCNNAIWFPQTVEDVEVLDEICTCSNKMLKLKFKFKRNSFPLYGSTKIACIGGCEPLFNEALNIKNENIKKTIKLNNSSSTSSDSSTLNFNQMSNSNRTQRSRLEDTDLNTISRNSNTQNTTRMQSSQTQNLNYNQRDQINNTIRQTTAQNKNANTSCGAPIDFITGNRPTATNQKASSTVQLSQTWGNIDDNAIIICKCNENAIKLTVRKEGPNQGRLFYKCAKPQGIGCDFFLWASDSNNISSIQNVSRITTNISNTNQMRQNEQINSDFNLPTWADLNVSTSTMDVKCNCGQSAKKLAVQKDGPNKGRHFYACPKGKGNGCNFFQWADNGNPEGNASGRGQFSGSHRDPAPKRSRATGAKRKCGICGTEGHTRKTCSMNVMD